MRRGRPLVVFCVLACVFASSASADWGGSDPTANFAPPGNLSCTGSRTGPACVDAGIAVLDQARASLGQPAYKLPADFPSLTPVEQMFILTDLDRVLYGLPPVPGLTAPLDADALMSGVQAGDDPSPSGQTGLSTWTSNWAAGYENVELAYEGWMYDDGLGGPNIDCTAGNTTGCWGHRHDILWEFDSSDTLAMGAATGTGPGSLPGYAMLLVGGDSSFAPAYTYTWAQAVADGAGTNDYNPSAGNPKPKPACVVPELVGRKLAAARRLVTAAHCSLGSVTKSYSRYRSGLIYAQRPAAGKTLAARAKVRIVVSKGLRR